MIAAIIVLPLILYGLGASTIALLGNSAMTEDQKASWKKNGRNPLICMLWGVPAVIILPFIFLDWAFNFKGTGYYDGREL